MATGGDEISFSCPRIELMIPSVIRKLLGLAFIILLAGLTYKSYSSHLLDSALALQPVNLVPEANPIPKPENDADSLVKSAPDVVQPPDVIPETTNVNPATIVQETIDEWTAYYLDLLNEDISGSYNGQALYDLCSAEEWHADLLVSCPPLEGGYGNTRQIFLQCIRLTIEMRGSLVMPSVSMRNDDDLLDYRTGNMAPLEYLFDTARLHSILKDFCPQLILIEPTSDLYELRTENNTFALNPQQLTGVGIEPLAMSLTDPSQFLPAFDEWVHNVNPNGNTPMVVALQRQIIWTWLTGHDSPGLVRSFGNMIRPNLSFRRLAAKALATLQIRHGSNRPHIRKGTIPFLGVHIRAEADAVLSLQLDYLSQATYIKERLANLPTQVKSNIIYAACGDNELLGKFKELAQPHMTVTKYDLLPPEDLDGLSWDQRALIDFLILERSAYFIGSGHSSFSTLLVLRRAAAFHWVIGGFPSEPCWFVNDLGRSIRRGCRFYVGLSAKGEYWLDDLSELIGEHDQLDSYIVVNSQFP